ncbi:sulfatase-like hydrolase/transferase [Caulobacter sp. CCH9-E1]|uniref:sulfatase-like hydrolase/transferase n=1 Tax=Caulobacter sp. CCH9-E1 TaxID=1768768 RepID=UPI00082BAC34|nr:sulfatase-like hydrolase/transferase [Caulobacter sp. CCH9-E1]
MRLLKALGAAVVVLGLAGALLWLFRFDLIILLARAKQPKIEAYRPVSWSPGPAAAASGERPPNVVFILADDLGYNDITLNGGGVAGGAVPTPAIDSIARQGVTFANGYAGNATCAPSRAAIMTGRYATRFGFEFTPTPVAFSRVVGGHAGDRLHPSRFNAAEVKNVPKDDSTEAVPSTEITIAEALKTRGYHTVHLGKWHLGGIKGSRPEDQGFDESLGFMAGASLFAPVGDPSVEESRQDFDPIDKFLWGALPYAVQYNGGPLFHPNRYMTDYLTDQAVAAIDANRNRPFFLYLAYNAVHTPLQAPKADYDALSTIKDHRLRVYAAMVRNLDRNVGRVLQALKDRGLDDNTLVIFTSDNGGANYIGLPDINRPYRGWKATFFEGGIKAPFLLRWPAQLPAGAVYRSPVAHVDIFATAAGAAGASPPKDRIMDGVDLVPFVKGKASGDPHKAIYWRSGRYKVVMAGGWKLQVAQEPNKIWLFDLANDPTERRDLAKARPDKVRELTAILAQLDSQMVKPAWPSLLSGAIYIDHPGGQPSKASDEYIYWDN